MLIVCALLLASGITLYAQENRPMMTVDETVAWAKAVSMPGLGYYVEPTPRPNPAARGQLWVILTDRQQEASWQWVVYSFRFLGQTEDVPRLVKWVEGFRGESFTYERAVEITRAESALGVMARRGVTGAQTALDKMMSPDYWHALSVTMVDSQGTEIPGRASFHLAMSAVGPGVYTRDPGFKAKVAKIAEDIADPKERKAFADRVKGAYDDYEAHMADGLLGGERLHRQLEEERQRANAEKKPTKPSGFAYNEAFYRWTVAKAAPKPIGRIEPITTTEDWAAYYAATDGRAVLDAAVRDRLVREAREAFEAIAKDLNEDKRAEVTARMCAAGIPCVLQDVDTSATAVEKIKDAKWWVYLGLEQAVVKSLASCHLDESGAIVKLSVLDKDNKDTVDEKKAAAEPEKNVDLIFVQIPYSDADGVKASDGLFLNPVIRFTESGPDGQVTLCMMKQAGHWYWMPFGE